MLIDALRIRDKKRALDKLLTAENINIDSDGNVEIGGNFMMTKDDRAYSSKEIKSRFNNIIKDRG